MDLSEWLDVEMCWLGTEFEKAWNMFLNRESNDETFLLLQLIANECYRCEEYWVAAKAFDMLEK